MSRPFIKLCSRPPSSSHQGSYLRRSPCQTHTHGLGPSSTLTHAEPIACLCVGTARCFFFVYFSGIISQLHVHIIECCDIQLAAVFRGYPLTISAALHLQSCRPRPSWINWGQDSLRLLQRIQKSNFNTDTLAEILVKTVGGRCDALYSISIHAYIAFQGVLTAFSQCTVTCLFLVIIICGICTF